MIAEQIALFDLPPPALPALPDGWRIMQAEGCAWAIDTDGIRWCVVDGKWKLYVPWFSPSDYCERAVCYREDGSRVLLFIGKDSRIRLPSGRMVGHRHWYH